MQGRAENTPAEIVLPLSVIQPFHDPQSNTKQLLEQVPADVHCHCDARMPNAPGGCPESHHHAAWQPLPTTAGGVMEEQKKKKEALPQPAVITLQLGQQPAVSLLQHVHVHCKDARHTWRMSWKSSPSCLAAFAGRPDAGLSAGRFCPTFRTHTAISIKRPPCTHWNQCHNTAEIS